MHFLYNIGVRLYSLGILLFSLFNSKAQKWIDGRRNYFLKLPDIPMDRKVIWFHCASLGEFDQGLPLMNKLKANDPDIYLLVTFFSPSGFEHYHKREHHADLVVYLPLDTPKNAKRFMEHCRPQQVFFVKYEFWANFILEAKRSKAKLYNVSGLFRENQHFFKWYGGFFRFILKRFDRFFVQNEKSKQLLNSIGITNVTVTGDCRFDRVLENKASLKGSPTIESFKGDDELFIIGSSWPEDEKILFDWINGTPMKVLIAPHDISASHLEFIEKHLKRPSTRFTQTNSEKVLDFEILILDTIGQLANAYSYGSIAYVGGGFSGNLHNILEPAVFGLPVIFGPKYSRFPEAQEFIERGIGFSVDNASQFNTTIKLVHNELDVLKSKTIQFVEQNAGASEKILSEVNASSVA